MGLVYSTSNPLSVHQFCYCLRLEASQNKVFISDLNRALDHLTRDILQGSSSRVFRYF